jgi:ribulose-5-phosphate 4-epimerase/fuculose-1-phosphate aldolase
VIGDVEGPLRAFARRLGEALEASGIVHTDDPLEADLVLNLIDAESPKPFRRKSRGTFVAALYALDEEPEDGLRESYPMLVRALANVVLCYVPSSGVSFTTMERGHYTVHENGGGGEFAHAVAQRLLPLATSRLVIENEFRADLEPELWDGDEITGAIGEAGRRLDALGLLPAPFPIEELLSERELRHVSRLYGIGGLSYGNLSARKDAARFWMSASGVDKSKLDVPNRDILLVSGYEPADAKMILSVSPNVEPRRVSVDAIEHWMIYRHHPDVGAILHVHAWMEGIAATDINYPCGTAELAGAVSALMAAEPDPAHAVIGLRNHGITATGDGLGEILDRIEPRLLRQVPMS